jgi:hypothetical protein
VKGALRDELECLQDALAAALELAYDGGEETTAKELEPPREGAETAGAERDARVA